MAALPVKKGGVGAGHISTTTKFQTLARVNSYRDKRHLSNHLFGLSMQRIAQTYFETRFVTAQRPDPPRLHEVDVLTTQKHLMCIFLQKDS